MRVYTYIILEVHDNYVHVLTVFNMNFSIAVPHNSTTEEELEEIQ